MLLQEAIIDGDNLSQLEYDLSSKKAVLERDLSAAKAQLDIIQQERKSSEYWMNRERKFSTYWFMALGLLLMGFFVLVLFVVLNLR